MAKTEGTPYLKFTDTAELTDLCQEQLNVYASTTHCIQADNVTFTPEIGTASYVTFTTPQTIGETTIPTAFSAALCNVRQVYIDGRPLLIWGDTLGRPGESSEYVISRDCPGYLANANGRPSAWWQELPNVLRFNCPFDLVYTNCWVSGRLYHSPLLTDNQVLDLPPEDVRPAARLASIALLDVFSAEKAFQLMQVAQAGMKVRRGQCVSKFAGTATMGTGTPREIINLGRG